jgi:hypothetical protein
MLDELFITIWQSSNEIDDVCNKLGITYYDAIDYAERLRQAGVVLQQLDEENHMVGQVSCIKRDD